MELKAAIYCRLSKEDVDKEGKTKESESIINQTLMLLDFVKQQGFLLYGIYQDDDYSGLFDDRPGFEKLISDAKAGKFQIVVAKTQSRFTRNMEHLEKYLHHDFPVWGIRFIGMVDNSDTANKGNKKARQINGLVNEWYCEDLSENIKASYRIKQKNGQFIGAAAPYGYIKDPEDSHKLKPDPYAAQIVRRIFDMYLLGMGKSRIAKILTDEGVLIPSEYKRKILKLNYHNAHESDSTTRWTLQTIDIILRNEVYVGNLVQNKSGVISYKDRKKVRLPQSQWIRVENTHVPIVDKETFQKVQQLLGSKTRKAAALPKKNIFAAVLYCGDCKAKMTPCYTKYNKEGKRARQYLCSRYKKYGNCGCTGHRIEEDILSEIILDDIRKQISACLDEKKKKQLLRFKSTLGMGNKEKTMRNLKREISKAEQYCHKAFENYADGVISRQDYIELKTKYQSKAAQLSEKISDLKNHGSCDEKGFDNWLDRITGDMNIGGLTGEIILGFIDKVFIFDDKKIVICYKFKTSEKQDFVA